MVLASSLTTARNFFGSGAPKAASSISRNSDPSSRSPSTPMTFIANPRGVDTLKLSRMSPGILWKTASRPDSDPASRRDCSRSRVAIRS